MADNEIRNPSKAYFKWKMPVIAKSEDDWNFWNTEDKYNRTMFIGYNDTTTPHVASLFMIVDGKAVQAVGEDVLARISKMETDVAEALADIQELINTANEQQQTIMQLQQQVQAVLLEVQGYVDDAHTWAEGSDADVANLGGEHSAKGWAQKANEIVCAGLPSDATFDHLTVTGISKFGKDPDRENQPGLEIEGTGEIQAYRTVNMMNGATVSYDETVEMPWSDNSNKVPNTAWVQQAVQHGSIDPNSELTVRSVSTTANFNLWFKDNPDESGRTKSYTNLHAERGSNGTTFYIDVFDSNFGSQHVYKYTMRAGNNNVASFTNPGSVTWLAADTLNLRSSMSDVAISAGSGRFVNINSKVRLGGTTFVVDATASPATATFGVTPTVPDITDAADSSDKVPNTKWVHAAIAAGGGGGGSGAVTSVNGKTGEVVLAATDVGAATTADITTALEPYAKTADVNTTLADYAKSADVTTEITTATAGLQPKLTAGANITISEDNVISATGGGTGGAVTSVNGKTGEVILSASDVGAASSSDLASYVTTDAMNTELTNFATTASVDTKLADYQRKLIAGDGIAISESNVISVTGGTGGGAVSSVNGKTGEVVLNATDVGAITGAEADTKITTALEPYAKTADVTTTLEPYAKSADVTAEITAAVAPLATTEALTTGLSGKQNKLTAGSGITISDTNVISATVSSPVDSVNGKTGTVVLSGEDIRLHPTVEDYVYPAVSDVIDTISDYLPDGVSYDNKLVDNSSLSTHLATYQPKLTAGEGITISSENVISATGSSGGGAVTSVNGNTGAVVLTGDNIMTASDSTTSLNSALAGKQDSLTDASDLTVGSLTAGSADSGLFASQMSLHFSTGGNDKLFVNSIGPRVSNLIGGDIGTATGAFDWYINTTTDYNKFNVYNRYHVTDEATHEVTTYDTSVLSIGGSPTDHSTWIDFTATYMSFKGNTNFGEAGMNHAMTFNGPSTFTGTATVHELIAGDGYAGTRFTCNTDADLNFNVNIGWTSGRLKCMRDEYNWLFDFNHSASSGQRIRFNDTVTILSAMPAATDSSNKVPTTAWVNTAITTAVQSNLLNYTTNRILEIPQDIKLELNNGTLTLKAGSKVYVPNGVGTFNAVTIASDVSIARTDSQDCIAWYNTDTGTLQVFPSILFYSGTTAPSDYQFMFWYDTTSNKCKVTSDSGSTWTEGKSFPICVVSTDGTKISTIKQIFNGFGYIDSTVFALPGVKVQTPNGRNEDGTYKTVIRTIDSVRTYDAGVWGTRNLNISFSGGVDSILFESLPVDWFTYNKKFSSDTATVSYDEDTGLWWFSPNQSSWSQISVNIVGSYRVESGKITSFEPYTVDSVANSNASNFSQSGRSYLSGLGMPSNRYEDLTLGANGTTYTAPANGWFVVSGKPTADGGYCILDTTNYEPTYMTTNTSGWYSRGFIPVRKGQVMTLRYENYEIEADRFKFVYAEGENNV